MGGSWADACAEPTESPDSRLDGSAVVAELLMERYRAAPSLVLSREGGSDRSAAFCSEFEVNRLLCLASPGKV